MRNLVFILPAVAMLLPLPLAGETQAPGPTLEITEWEVPYENARPRDPWRGPDGKVWFVGQMDHYVATLDPATGEFERIDLVDGAGPHTVIVDRRGAWYAGNRVAHIGRIDLDSHQVEVIPVPGEGTRDPHTMAFNASGDIWFTAQHGNFIGFHDATSGKITRFAMQTAKARPYGLEVDGRGRPWAVLFGTNRLATVDIDSGEVTEIELPREDARPRRIGITPDQRIWYVDFTGGYLGVYDPASGEIEEWLTPGGVTANLYAMGVDGAGRVWMVETGSVPNRFVGFDPETERFGTPVPVPSGAGVVRHMSFDPEANAFWFGTDFNTIGRATIR